MKYFILLTVISFAFGDRMTSKIYENLEAESFCFRLLNATHQIGCTSNPSGNVGVIHVVDSPENLKWVLQDGPDAPYIAALTVDYFTMGNMTNLVDSQRVTGVLVLQGTNETSYPQSGYSPENACPNENYGLYVDDDDRKEFAHCRKNTWNPTNQALGMLYQDWKMPIVMITNSTQVDQISNDCYKRFNEPINGTARSWPLCAAEITSFMLAAKDSPTCMRRSNKVTNMNPVKLCDPLGSRNIITMLFPTNATKGIRNRSVITLSARLDAASMFDGFAPGGDSVITGLVALLSVALTLSTAKEDIIKHLHESRPSNVLFTIFNGETFDYIGSSRAVFDMERNEFPQALNTEVDQLALIKLKHISHFFEINQIAPQMDESKPQYWMHSDPFSTKDPKINATVLEMMNTLKSQSNNLISGFLNEALPPASLQRFLIRDLSIPGVVISNFKDKFTNKFYNGRFDNRKQLPNNTGEYVAKISTAVAKTIYKLLTGEENPSLSANQSIIEEMLECYLDDAACLLFRQIASPEKLTNQDLLRTQPYSLYVSVDNQGHINPITIYTRYLMAFLTGETLTGNYDQNNCTGNSTDNVYEYDWMVGSDINSTGVCVKSIVKYTMAISPAAVLNDWQSKEYSTWTESVWQTVTLRIFLRPSRSLEGLTFGVGIAILVLSVTIVYSINKRASILFGSRTLMAC